MGEFSSGKSSLINSLLKRDILSTNTLPTTKNLID
ncbi:MAG: dynamin family protein [Campylobacter sp.]|nr:dynamin family protein [Campylobacter sp.]